MRARARLNDNLDPRVGTDSVSQNIHQVLFNGILKIDEHLKLVPDLEEILASKLRVQEIEGMSAGETRVINVNFPDRLYHLASLWTILNVPCWSWSVLISSFVVTSTSTRSPCPINPSTTFRKRESPWPTEARARRRGPSG